MLSSIILSQSSYLMIQLADNSFHTYDPYEWINLCELEFFCNDKTHTLPKCGFDPAETLWFVITRPFVCEEDTIIGCCYASQ